MPDVLTLAEQYKAQLAAKDAAAMKRLINAYRTAFVSLSDKLELLMLDIGGNIPTPGQLARMERYKALMAQAAIQLRDLEALTRVEMEAAAKLGIELGGQHARGLIAATMADQRLAAAFNSLPNDAIRQLLGFLSPEGELYKRLGMMSEYGASALSDALVNGITLGYNPRKMAAILRQTFGVNLTDALRTVRTAQLWAYREASRATMVANQEVLEGWQWDAKLDERTCASCIAQHGTIHPLTEPLDDHYNGRCVALPVVKGMPPVIEQSGEEWFRSQDEATQRKILGNKKCDALLEGKFEFSALSKQVDDAVYGSMKIEAPLKDLIGE